METQGVGSDSYHLIIKGVTMNTLKWKPVRVIHHFAASLIAAVCSRPI